MAKSTPPKKRGRKPGKGNNTRRGGTSPGPRTPRGSTSKGAKTESIEQTAIGVRRELVVHYHIQHRLSLAQIAKRLAEEHNISVTPKTLSLDLNAVLEEAHERTVRNMVHGQAISAARLDQLDQQLVPLALGQLPPGKEHVVGRGKKKRTVTIPIDGAQATRIRMEAIAELRRNDESRRKLFGFDAQQEAGYSAEQVARLLMAVRGDLLELVTDVETRRAIAQALQRRSGLLAGNVIDVKAEATDGQPAGA